jgi:Flp pilus assembly protein TadD
VATASWDGTVRVWDATNGQTLTPPLKHDQGVWGVCFSSDGSLLLARTEQTARVWDAATGDPVTPTLGQHERVACASFAPDGGRVLTGSLDSTGAQVWDLPAENRPLEELLLLAEVLTGEPVDATGGLSPVEAERVQSAWQALRARYPQSVTPVPEQVQAWHRAEAKAAQAAGRWSAALSPLDDLIAAGRANWGSHVSRGSVYAELDRWDRAAADFETAIRLGAVDSEVWFFLAMARLAQGDVDGYRKTCADLLPRFEDSRDPETALVVAQCCALAPDGVANPARFVDHLVSGKITERQPYPSLFRAGPGGQLNALKPVPGLGALLYRTGRFQEAVQRLAQEAEAFWDDWLFLAMAHGRLGNVAEARQWLDKAQRWADQNRTRFNWLGRLRYQLLRREAEAIVPSAG